MIIGSADQIQVCKALVYGPSGSGKTVLCATAPNMILLSAESGTLSLRKANLVKLFGPDNPNITYDVPIIQIRNLRDLYDAYAWLNSDNGAPYQTICLDSLSEIAETVLNHAKSTVKDPRMAYVELQDKMRELIRGFRDIPNKNVVFVCKQSLLKDDVTGLTQYGPSMPGSKLGNELAYFFDEVLRVGLFKNEEGVISRFIQTNSCPQYVAKDRSGALPFFTEANLSQIFQQILSN